MHTHCLLIAAPPPAPPQWQMYQKAARSQVLTKHATTDQKKEFSLWAFAALGTSDSDFLQGRGQGTELREPVCEPSLLAAVAAAWDKQAVEVVPAQARTQTLRCTVQQLAHTCWKVRSTFMRSYAHAFIPLPCTPETTYGIFLVHRCATTCRAMQVTPAYPPACVLLVAPRMALKSRNMQRCSLHSMTPSPMLEAGLCGSA